MSVDVLVVGLGPAGSRAAAAAANGGCSVLAIDRRARAGVPVQCAEFVPALLQQEVPGLAAACVQPIRRMLTAIEGGPFEETPDFPGRMLDRARFDALLAARAVSAGASCRFGVATARITRDGAVSLTDGTPIRPRVLIGADGPRSRVGAAIVAVNTALVEARQIRVPLRRPHDATDIFLSAAYPGGYGWLFPARNEANLGIGVVPAARPALKGLLEALHAALTAAGRIGPEVLGLTGGLIPVGGRIRASGRLGSVSVLLVGDAAGLAHPVSGAGIAAAVQSGTLAGEAAASLLAGQPSAAADYEDELASLFDGTFARALSRRHDLLACHTSGRPPDPARQRAGWIGFASYWEDGATPAATTPSIAAPHAAGEKVHELS